jgi:hypothetical protein
MKERDIQNYLYENPEALFPSGNITEKSYEYIIHDKRVDLFFVVDGIRYIVEVKNVPIKREHIGQVIEYYGLMKHYMNETNLAMVLVSSSIPAWRAAYLEELGIRCVEISNIPTTIEERKRIQKKSRNYYKKFKEKTAVDSILGAGERMTFQEITGPLSSRGVAFTHRMLRDSLEPIRKSFSDYEVIVPFSIKRVMSHHFVLEHDPKRNYGARKLTHGRPWWAYSFGDSEGIPPNDVPNISINGRLTGLFMNLNAEVMSSQRVMLERIKNSISKFNKLLSDHGGLWLKTYLKFEHQPRFYHWILSELRFPQEFSGEDILEIRRDHEESYMQKREHWIKVIKAENRELTNGQIRQLEKRSRRLNLVIHLAKPFEENAILWSLPYEKQVSEIVGEVQRMKPLLDFFVK